MGRKKTKSKDSKGLKSDVQTTKPQFKWYEIPRWHILGILLISFVLYANTLGHDYTQDDAIVIYDNMFTQQGISGIPGILKNDTFYGFFKEEGKANLVSGGRYRPFTLILFALEWQFFGRNPMIGHFLNILFYGFLGIMIYHSLRLLLVDHIKMKSLTMLALATSIIYIAHPIHTEVVANIKGRDEIISMLGSIIALWAILKNETQQKLKYTLLALSSFFVALMSKENAITFLAIIPLSLFVFKGKSIVESLRRSWSLFVSALLFLMIRFSILGFDFGDSPNELMNNPFLKIVNNTYVDFSFPEKLATILVSLGKYIQLLIFPHPLSHDYYPRSIDIMKWGDWQTLISLLLYTCLIGLLFYFWKKDKIIAFGISFYLITLSIVSNIVFPIGTIMSERFMFMPSLGLILVISWLIFKSFKNSKLILACFFTMFFLLSAKTIERNPVWKDDYTLFTTDVKNNPKSAKLLNAAGGAMTTRAAKMAEGPQKTAILRQAIVYLEKAIDIHPAYRNAYLLLGNAHYYLQDYENSIAYFDRALSIDANFQDALSNLPIVLRDGGRFMGQKMNNFVKAEEWLLRSYQMNPKDYETSRLLGITYGIQGQDNKAIEYFLKAIELRPDIATNYSSLGTAYLNLGNKEKAREAFNKAVELDPKALQHLTN